MAREKAKVDFALPAQVASPVDIARLGRELDSLNETLLQLGLRGGGSGVKMPTTSQLMDQIVHLNKLNLLDEADRLALGEFLATIRQKAPVIHMSFGADPSPAFVEKLMVWLRQEIDPVVLLTVGLQPNLGAGCMIRSTNKYFDLSLRRDFLQKRDLLISKLIPPTAAPVPATVVPTGAVT